MRTPCDARRLRRSLAQAAVIVDDSFLGQGYARPTDAGMAARRAFDRLGISLDDVYGAKAAAALLHAVAGPGGDAIGGPGSAVPAPVLFIHTGGNGGVYY